MPQRLADSLAQGIVALDFSLDRPELRNRETLLGGGLLDRQVVVFLHRLVNADVLIDLAGRDVLVVLLVGLRGRGGCRGRLRRKLQRTFNPGDAPDRSDWRRPRERSRKYSTDYRYRRGRRA